MFWEHMLKLQNQLLKSGGPLLDEFEELKARKAHFFRARRRARAVDGCEF